MNSDLISREALKKALHNFFDGKVINEPAYILRDVFCYIESAPTVDTTCPHCDSGYAQGYSDGYLRGKEERPQVTVFCENADEKAIADMKEELQKVIDDLKPQGEWTDLSTDGRHTGWIACSACGQEPPNESNIRTNFCPNCGAKMKGGAE